MTTAPMVVLKDIAKRWNGQLGVEGISLDIPEGSFTALLGPSGCGKSTTLRLLAGLELPDEGTILIDGKDVTTSAASDRNLSMVFQSYALFPHLSVAETSYLASRCGGFQNKSARKSCTVLWKSQDCLVMRIASQGSFLVDNASGSRLPALSLRASVFV